MVKVFVAPDIIEALEARLMQYRYADEPEIMELEFDRGGPVFCSRNPYAVPALGWHKASNGVTYYLGFWRQKEP